MDERLKKLASKTRHSLHLIGNMARKRASDRPQETRWTIGGFFAGVGLYAIIGGVGLALMGTAISLLTWLMFPIAGLLIGRRLGKKRDKLKPLLPAKVATVEPS